MKLPFDEITGKTKRYSIGEGDWHQSEDEAFTVIAAAEIAVCRRDHHTVLLTGELSGEFTSACARCGEQVKEMLHTEFEYLVTTQREEILLELREVECSDEKANTLYLQEPDIDVDEILREQIYLAVPLRTLCSEDCKGICSGCGAELNRGTCSCSIDNSDSPFAVLGKLGNR